MITIINDDTEIKSGQYVCANSTSHSGICVYPRKVTRVAGQRIYFIRDGGNGEEYMARHRAGYLCDTPEEGKALCDLGIERINAVSVAERAAWRSVIEQFKPRIAALLAGQPDPGPAPENNPLVDLLREAIRLMPLGQHERADWLTRASALVRISVDKLRDVLPNEFMGGEFDNTPAYKLRNEVVVAKHKTSEKRWPGVHKNVHVWYTLANGQAVGWNEHPSRGWSFPVVTPKYDIKD